MKGIASDDEWRDKERDENPRDAARMSPIDSRRRESEIDGAERWRDPRMRGTIQSRVTMSQLCFINLMLED